MEDIDVRPRWEDLAPFYGFGCYLGRATSETPEKLPVGSRILRGSMIITEILYNGFLGHEIYNLTNGKPTLTQKLLENIF